MSCGDDRSRSYDGKTRRKRSPRSAMRQRERESSGNTPSDIGATLALLLKGQDRMIAGQTEMNEKLTNVSNEVTNVKEDVKNFRGEVEDKFKKQQGEIDALKQRPEAPAVNCYSVAGDGGNKGGGKPFVPKSQRRIVVVRGYPYDTLGQDIAKDLKDITQDYASSLEDVNAPGKLTSSGRLVFNDPGSMWNFLKRMKGNKLKSKMFPEAKLWHSIEQTESERLMSIRVSYINKQFKEYVIEKGLAMDDEGARRIIDGDWARGYVFVRLEGSKPVRLMEYNRSEEKFQKGAEVDTLGWTFNFPELLEHVNNMTSQR